jgi:UDP-N-acetylmuramoyl-tripeptide--D-alanyl-D-alanine ligase
MRWYLYIPFLGIVYRQLYFLQLENYELNRFVKLVPQSYRIFRALRQDLVWTPKLVLVANLSLLLEVFAASFIGLVAATSALEAILIALSCLVAFFLFHFIFLIVAVALVSPLDALAKRRIIGAAQGKLREHPGLTIIAVAGSYGKTTMKEILVSVLSEKFRVLATPGNINTPVGISRVILKDLVPATEVMVVEMGEHYPGDLRFLGEFLRPDISVITGINEAHLERFGSLDRLAEGIFEAVDATKEHGLIVLNADNPHIVERYTMHRGERAFAFYSSHESPLTEYRIGKLEFREDGSGMDFEVSDYETSLGKLSLPLIGEYAVGASIAALIIARRLGMPIGEFRKGLASLKPIPHRLQVLPSQNGVLVIDDSYNGNPEGVRYAIRALARFTKRRKVYVTPGLVEAGPTSEPIHREIGRELAPVADVVVLIQNSVTSFIARELLQHGFPKEHILWFKNGPEAHAAIPEIVKSGDVILFQNDWPDNYL